MPGTELDGGCFVLAPEQLDYRREGVWHEAAVVNRERGAEGLAQYAVRVKGRPSDARSFPGSETALYVLSGHGLLEIGPQRFDLAPGTAGFVGPDEAFRLASEEGESLEMLVTVCPPCESPKWHAKPPERFDATHADRTVTADAREPQSAGERSYVVLVDGSLGCRRMTQFQGTIPKSRATPHYHEYEEAIVVLEGEGIMHTEENSAEVGPLSLIYLPRRVRHSLECTSKGGLTLVGVFQPAGSPNDAHEE